MYPAIPANYDPKNYPIPERFATAAYTLPEDAPQATLVGRVHIPDIGPRVVVVRGDLLIDITETYGSVASLLEEKDIPRAVRETPGFTVGTIEEVLANTPVHIRDESSPYLMMPTEQPVMAIGVTFVESLIGRLIEERLRGNLTRENELHTEVLTLLGEAEQVAGMPLKDVKPGSAEAQKVIDFLINEKGVSPHYLNVGYGPYTEIFPKALNFNAVGAFDVAGYHPFDLSTNPESELALVTNSRGETVGAVLSNDNNGRKLESLSALLVSYMKGTNRASAIGPFLRICDENFGPQNFRELDIHLEVSRPDGQIILPDISYSIGKFSREFNDVVRQMYHNAPLPEGAILSLGTGASPKLKRDPGAPERGFFLMPGDNINIWSPRLGHLVTSTGPSDQLPRNQYGIRRFAEDATAREIRRLKVTFANALRAKSPTVATEVMAEVARLEANQPAPKY